MPNVKAHVLRSFIIENKLYVRFYQRVHDHLQTDSRQDHKKSFVGDTSTRRPWLSSTPFHVIDTKSFNSRKYKRWQRLQSAFINTVCSSSWISHSDNHLLLSHWADVCDLEETLQKKEKEISFPCPFTGDISLTPPPCPSRSPSLWERLLL